MHVNEQSVFVLLFQLAHAQYPPQRLLTKIPNVQVLHQLNHITLMTTLTFMRSFRIYACIGSTKFSCKLSDCPDERVEEIFSINSGFDADVIALPEHFH